MRMLSRWILALCVAGAGPAWADSYSAHSRVLFGGCAVCHSLDAGKNLVGPNLAEVYGRKSAAVAGYSYSKAMAAAELTWDTKTLDQFLAAPTTLVPGTKMLVGVKNGMDRADIIAYLREVP